MPKQVTLTLPEPELDLLTEALWEILHKPPKGWDPPRLHDFLSLCLTVALSRPVGRVGLFLEDMVPEWHLRVFHAALAKARLVPDLQERVKTLEAQVKAQVKPKPKRKPRPKRHPAATAAAAPHAAARPGGASPVAPKSDKGTPSPTVPAAAAADGSVLLAHLPAPEPG